MTNDVPEFDSNSVLQESEHMWGAKSIRLKQAGYYEAQPLQFAILRLTANLQCLGPCSWLLAHVSLTNVLVAWYDGTPSEPLGVLRLDYFFGNRGLSRYACSNVVDCYRWRNFLTKTFGSCIPVSFNRLHRQSLNRP